MTEYVHCELCKQYFTASEHGEHEAVCKWSVASRRSKLASRRRKRKGSKNKRGRGRMIGAGIGREVDRLSYKRMRNMKRKKSRLNMRRRRAMGVSQ